MGKLNNGLPEHHWSDCGSMLARKSKDGVEQLCIRGAWWSFDEDEMQAIHRVFCEEWQGVDDLALVAEFSDRVAQHIKEHKKAEKRRKKAAEALRGKATEAQGGGADKVRDTVREFLAAQ